nr:HNH endonuclease [uncultured Pseudomonas sp.]
MPSITIAGREVLFDEKDAALVLGFRWSVRVSNNTAYVQRLLYEGGKYCGYESLHRRIMQCPEGMVVDHINGDGLDNRRANLRICLQRQNLMNRRIHCNNRSGFKGVYHDPSCTLRPWRAEIRANGKKVRLGFFADPEDAHKAYLNAAARLHGDFARAS